MKTHLDGSVGETEQNCMFRSNVLYKKIHVMCSRIFDIKLRRGLHDVILDDEKECTRKRFSCM